MNDTQSGANCGGGNNNPPCAPWTTCTNGTCQALFSVANGGHCLNGKQCSSGYCNVGNCTTLPDSITTCSTDADCSTAGGNCTCSLYTGKQYCSGLFDPCTEDKSSLVTCLAGASCNEATNAPNSCSYKNCASEYKKAFSCSCSEAKTTIGSCSYNAYCGGFPIWAIIIIIVVAIVLVLGIVLLVFFMMRRRRQYESI